MNEVKRINLINEKSKMLADSLIMFHIFRQSGEPILNPNQFFTTDLQINSLGLAYTCHGIREPVEFVLSKTAYFSLIEPFLFAKLLGFDGQIIFKVYDGYEGKVLYYDPLLNLISFTNGIKMTNEKKFYKKEVSESATFPILLVEPNPSQCDELKEITVLYPEGIQKMKMVPAVFYIEFYK